ncbi:hypothetical protein Q31b_35120 [Novipirellula aureliae]|uniref:Uncharacterized protein n=1 Tax=Novipirellula aureliae TaxID=2527966 RepID=A0A5C6DW63_9BACT|nr:hypothetical protein Q31b_35120 [Novipirellula aureliae]
MCDKVSEFWETGVTNAACRLVENRHRSVLTGVLTSVAMLNREPESFWGCVRGSNPTGGVGFGVPDSRHETWILGQVGRITKTRRKTG